MPTSLCISTNAPGKLTNTNNPSPLSVRLASTNRIVPALVNVPEMVVPLPVTNTNPLVATVNVLPDAVVPPFQIQVPPRTPLVPPKVPAANTELELVTLPFNANVPLDSRLVPVPASCPPASM